MHASDICSRAWSGNSPRASAVSAASAAVPRVIRRSRCTASGFTWNINQVYSVRGEYQVLSNVGQDSRTGTEDLKTFAIGMIMRF